MPQGDCHAVPIGRPGADCIKRPTRAVAELIGDHGAVDKREAHQVAAAVLSGLRAEPYENLVDQYLDMNESREVVGESGVQYQVEVDGFWDDRKAGHLRILVSVNDGGRSAFHPLTDGFIRAPGGSFVRE